MVYLDYSATTPINLDVLDSYNKVSRDYIGNANSLHSLGMKSRDLLNRATFQISELLNVKENEITYKTFLSSTEPLLFLDKLKKLASQKILFALQNEDLQNDYLELDVSFFINGIMTELLKYFRDESDYNLDELHENMIKWFNRIF